MKPASLHIIGTVLLEKRLDAGLTQKQLAESAGITQERVRQIEKAASCAVWPHTARHLARALGCRQAEIASVRGTAEGRAVPSAPSEPAAAQGRQDESPAPEPASVGFGGSQ